MSVRADTAKLLCHATDNAARFRMIGACFCGGPVVDVEHVLLDDTVQMDLASLVG